MNVPPALRRYEAIVPDFPRFVQACLEPLARTFWTNPGRGDPETRAYWLSLLAGETTPVSGLGAAFRLSGHGSHPFVAGYLAGLFHLQETASMLPVVALDPRSGDRVLDLCAAPGNKTAQIAAAVAPAGSVVANDVSMNRLGVLRATVDRLGLTNVRLSARDGTHFAEPLPTDPEDGRPVRSPQFDRVLVDAPCSCEGTSRRNTDVLFRADPDPGGRMANRQRLLLENAFSCCRPGGRIVYATCTYSPEECEAVVSDALDAPAARGVAIVPAKIPGFVTRPGLTSFDGRRFRPELAKTVRIWPHENDTGGFFIAAFEKDPDDSHDADVGDHGRSRQPFSGPQTSGPMSFLYDELDRFGIPKDAVSRYELVGDGRKYAHLVDGSMSDFVSDPGVAGDGVRAVNRKGGAWRLSTAGVMLLGTLARNRILDLDLDDLYSYLRRNDVEMAHRGSVTGKACLVRSGGLAFGRGELANGPVGSRLISLFPRVWAGVEVRTRLGFNEA